MKIHCQYKSEFRIACESVIRLNAVRSTYADDKSRQTLQAGKQ